MQSMCALLIDVSQLLIESHVPRFVLSFSDTCTRPPFLDLEQTSLYSAGWPLCSLRCLPGALFTDRSRLPFVAVPVLSGSKDRELAVLYRRSVRTRREDERERERKRKGRKREYRCAWSKTRKKFPDEFSRRPAEKNLDACLTTTREKKTRKGKTRKEKKEKSLKCTAQRLHFSRHLTAV